VPTLVITPKEEENCLKCLFYRRQLGATWALVLRRHTNVA